MKEIWYKIPGFPSRYELSTLGRIQSLAHMDAQGRFLRGKIIVPYGESCRIRIQLLECHRTKRYCPSIGCLMLLTFVRPSKEGEIARHLNDNPWDNRLENLAWGTKKDNIHDAIRNGSLGPGSYQAKRTSETHRGRKRSEETKQRIRESWIVRHQNMFLG